MQYRRLGCSGLKVSVLSLGSWVTFGPQLGVDSASKVMEAAVSAGVNFFDNAEAYSGRRIREDHGAGNQESWTPEI